MSFSQEVKNEILRRKISKPCCNMAAAYAVACFGKYFDDRGVVLQTENEGVAHFAQKLYRRSGVQGTVISKERPTGPVYEFSVKDPDEVAKMLALFGRNYDGIDALWDIIVRIFDSYLAFRVWTEISAIKKDYGTLYHAVYHSDSYR